MSTSDHPRPRTAPGLAVVAAALSLGIAGCSERKKPPPQRPAARKAAPLQVLVPPRLPGHLEQVGGFFYARSLKTEREPPPPRFSRPLSVRQSEQPPRATIVAGLESDRFQMRRRFERSLATGGNDALLKRLLGLCYAGIFGLRGDGPRRTGFDAWVKTLPRHVRTGRKPRPRIPASRRGRLLRKVGLQMLGPAWETGHTPADHDSFLYDFADYVPVLAGAYFEQRVLLAPDHRAWSTRDRRVAYTLRAWIGGRRFEAPALNHGDFADSWSLLGFVNALLRTLGDPHRWVFADGDGETVVVGTAEAIASARRSGVLPPPTETRPPKPARRR